KKASVQKNYCAHHTCSFICQFTGFNYTSSNSGNNGLIPITRCLEPGMHVAKQIADIKSEIASQKAQLTSLASQLNQLQQSSTQQMQSLSQQMQTMTSLLLQQLGVQQSATTAASRLD